ncbi:hypothetical protein CQY20_28365 [Mycolicibacterium agri]|uniref:ESX-1 secretion-associated protein n=1 Tax=Mycolicibacterium agri TaxID=36811 RepID=A0A2A7MQ11_MYCAG|nr:hypothetical protein CQY20_28365 [Mycolicibacterium agri]
MSASTVDAHADMMRAAHVAADGKTEAAQVGVPTRSVVALTAAVTKWQADSTALFTRLSEHAGALREGAVAYDQTDEHSATAIDAAGDDIINLGL